MPNKVCLVSRTWACKRQSGSLQGQRAQTSVRSPESKGNSQCRQQRRIDGLDPKQTNCPTKTKQEKEFIYYENKLSWQGLMCDVHVLNTLLSSSAVRLLQCWEGVQTNVMSSYPGTQFSSHQSNSITFSQPIFISQSIKPSGTNLQRNIYTRQQNMLKPHWYNMWLSWSGQVNQG